MRALVPIALATVVLLGAVIGAPSAAQGSLPSVVIGPELPVADTTFVEPAISIQSHPSIAVGATNKLIAWRDERMDGWGIFATLATPDGDPYAGPGIRLTDHSAFRSGPRVSWNGSSYFVVWSESDGSATPGVYGRRVSPSGALLGPIVAIATGVNQAAPSIDWDGTRHLVVWQESSDQVHYDVVARWITSDGASDGAPFPVSASSGTELNADVAWNGTYHLVAWQQGPPGGDPAVVARRVQSDGTLLDPGGIDVSNATPSYFPRVAGAGTRFLVSWQGYQLPWSTIKAGTVLNAGSVDNRLVVSAGMFNRTHPQVSWNGSQYLIAWADERDSPGEPETYAARLTAEGALTDPDGILVTAGGQADYNQPAVGARPSGFVVADGSGDIYSRRVTDGGEVENPAGTLVSVRAQNEGAPAIAWDGTNYLASWTQSGDGARDATVYAGRLSPTGDRLDGAGLALTQAPMQQYSAVAWNGSRYLVVWEDASAGFGYEDLRGSIIRADGVVENEGFPISTAQGPQEDARVSASGSDFLVVWSDWRGTQYEVYGARVSTNGTLLDPNGILLSPDEPADQAPSVAWNGANWLVAWQAPTSSPIGGTRVSPTGQVLDPQGIVIQGGGAHFGYSPGLASNGSSYFAVWQDSRSDGDAVDDVYGTRIASSGAVQDSSGIRISHGLGRVGEPQIAWNGKRWVAAWRRATSFHGGTIDTSRVSPSGAADPAESVVVPEASNERLSLSTGPNGRNALSYSRAVLDTPYFGLFQTYVRWLDDPEAPPPPPPPPVPPPPPPPAPPKRCVVPRLVGMKLPKARTRIRRARCAVGRIRRVKSRRVGRVLRQSPRPGVRRPRGTRVNLVLGRR